MSISTVDGSASAINAQHQELIDELEGALRKQGYRALCRGHERDADGSLGYQVRLLQSFAWMARTALAIIVWVALTFGFTFAHHTDLAWWGYAGASLVALVPLSTLLITRLPDLSWFSPSEWRHRLWKAGIVVATAWAASLAMACYTTVKDGVDAAAFTHGVPGAIVLGTLALAALAYLFVRLYGRRLRGATTRSIALVFPIGVVVLFVPLFTAELWTVAHELKDWRALPLAGLTVLPLFLLLCRQLRGSVPDAFAKGAERLGGEDALDSLKKKVPGTSKLPEAAGENPLTKAFRKEALERRAAPVAEAVKGPFRLFLVVGLVPVVLGILALMFLYIYALAWITIDVAVVEDWLTPQPEPGRPAPERVEVPTLGLPFGGLEMPAGPYFTVALVLGVLATAAFLAYSMTEDAYKSALADAAIHSRVRDCLLIAMPYVQLITPNDSRSKAQAIGDGEHEARGDNSFATDDSEDDPHSKLGTGRSLWYRWTAPESGWVTFDVSESEFAPLVVVYDCGGTALGDRFAGHAAVRLRVRANQSYDVAVDASRNGSVDRYGEFTLRWFRSPGPENDAFDRPRELKHDHGSETGDNTLASTQPGEPRHAGVEGGASLWYRWKAERSGAIEFSVEKAAFAPVLAVYEGDSLRDVKPLAAGAAGPENVARVTFDAEEDREYRLAVSGRDGERGAFSLRWAPPPTPPPNDDFDAAIHIGDLHGEQRADTSLASTEDGAPGYLGKSVWYRWTAPEAGWVTFSTAGSKFDTLLAVYTGTALDDLHAVAINDDRAPGDRTSRVRFYADAGREYRVAVGGHAESGGSLRLAWEPAPPPPDNDMFATAHRLPSEPEGAVEGITELATVELGEPEHADKRGGASIWFRWTAPESGWVTFSTAGSDFDTLLAVYTGTELTELVPVAANDDAPGGGLTSEVWFEADAGVEYRIAVDGYYGARGRAILRWRSVSRTEALRYRLRPR